MTKAFFLLLATITLLSCVTLGTRHRLVELLGVTADLAVALVWRNNLVVLAAMCAAAHVAGVIDVPGGPIPLVVTLSFLVPIVALTAYAVPRSHGATQEASVETVFHFFLVLLVAGLAASDILGMIPTTPGHPE